ncbi:hypothetical protein PR202_gb16105 [Eleusine coracana subsp. coracana]|uniref:Uncharacterized protein n=1 Tax=Eleusine coracana subsp. coracana TaxID=191504 RepID=A0AAV5EZM0_ELECO|nr:hypothetical protein PR202_gb16105 [Eleusine coracana subsp. coracana]
MLTRGPRNLLDGGGASAPFLDLASTHLRLQPAAASAPSAARRILHRLRVSLSLPARESARLIHRFSPRRRTNSLHLATARRIYSTSLSPAETTSASPPGTRSSPCPDRRSPPVSSGKSEAVACLTAALRSSSADLTVRIIDESSLHLGRNDSYKVGCCDMYNALTFMRLQGSFVIQKWTTVGNGIASARRKENPPMIAILQSGRIASDTLFYRGRFEDLVRRFEKPDRRNRWDSPLFELFPSRDEMMESSPVIAEAVSYLTKKVDSKTRDVKVLQPTIATQTVRTTEANSLYEMDKATQEVVNAIVEAQSCGLGLTMNKISLGPNMPTISFSDG